MNPADSPLRLLQRMMQEYYEQYSSGEINEKEYLDLIRPIDQAIDNMEMATLRDTPAWIESFSLPAQSQEN